MTSRVFLLVVLLVAAVPRRALADDVAQAKAHFSVAARAYEEKKFRVAIDAFEESYRLAPRPAILFSVAQAHRRQYFIDRQDRDLTQAIAYYRRYIADEPKGKRVGEASGALSDLEPLAARKGLEGKADVAAAQPRVARILIASSVKHATAVVDNGQPIELPNRVEVSPGKHTVVIEAEGHAAERREVEVGSGESFPLDVRMTERPGVLALAVEDSTRVYVDGRVVATTPLGKPLEVAPGQHAVSFARNGHDPVSVGVAVGPGEVRRLDVGLAPSAQRVSAYVVFGLAAVSLVGGGVLTGLALHEQGQAQDIDAKAGRGIITETERKDHESALERRDQFRVGAVVGYAGGGALALTGALLFLFDDPEPTIAPMAPSAPGRPLPGPAPGDEAPELDVGFGPAGGAVTLRMRF